MKDGILYWFDREQFSNSDFSKHIKGSLELSECEICDGTPTNTKESANFNIIIRMKSFTDYFDLYSNNNRNNKNAYPPVEYVLTSKISSEMMDWIKILRGAQEEALKEIKRHQESLLLKKGAFNEMRGYLIKKGKRRLFVLKERMLSWYSDENNDKSQGKLSLLDYMVELSCENRNTIALRGLRADCKPYVLIARTSIECKEWLFHLQNNEILSKASLLNENSNVDVPHAIGAPFSSTSISTSNRIERHSIPSLATGKSMQANISLDQQKNRSSVDSAVYLSSILGNATGSQQLEKHGWLIKKGKRRFFLLQAHILMWFTREQSPKQPNYNLIRGSIPMTDSYVEHHVHEFSFSIKTSQGKIIALTARTVKECNEWVDILRLSIELSSQLLSKNLAIDRSAPDKTSYEDMKEGPTTTKKGWLLKKGLLRWFQLSDDQLRWYISEGSEDKLKGFLPLYNCCINDLQKDYSFIIASPQGKSYTLFAKEAADKNDWMQCLQRAIYYTNKIMESGLEKRGWLEKHKQRRWFALKGSTLFWFSQQQPFENISTENANNYICISDWSFLPNPNDSLSFDMINDCDSSDSSSNSFNDTDNGNNSNAGVHTSNSFSTLFTHSHSRNSYTLRAINKKEMEEWLFALNRCKERVQRSFLSEKRISKARVFGVLLADQQFNEQGEIPVAVEKMISFLVEHGLDTVGLFGLNCNEERMHQLKALIESDPNSVKFNPCPDDVHCVATLLKLFFRTLPEPIIDSSIYPSLLAANVELDTICSLLKTLPLKNISVLKYVLDFLFHYSGNTQMNISNLATIFGPIFIRISDGTTSNEIPESLTLMNALIANHSQLFR